MSESRAMTGTGGPLGSALADLRHLRLGALAGRAGRVLGRGFWPLAALLSYPLVLLLRPLVLIRVSPIPSRRLGHFALRAALYLAETELGMHPRRAFDVFFIRPSEPCNPALYAVLKRSMRFWQPARYFYRLYSKLPGGKAHLAHPFAQNYGDQDADGVLGVTGPAVSLSLEETEQGWRELEHRGVPRGTEFVCFHARSEIYVRDLYKGGPKDRETRNSYRNSEIENFLPAVEAMVGRGYHALRMGAMVEKPLPAQRHPHIHDYANEFRSDFMDVFLLSSCRFLIANGSGPDAVSELFRRPVVFVDFISWGGAHTSMFNVTIFKRLWLKEEKRFVTFRESFEKDWHYIIDTWRFDEHGIELIPNTPEEIAEAVAEMEARLDGTWVETEENLERQARFREIFGQNWLHKHPRCFVGASFLRDNAFLLD